MPALSSASFVRKETKLAYDVVWPQHLRGLSLVELLVVLAIFAVLLGIGVPSLHNYVASSRLSSAASEFFAALNFARSEAMRRQARVVIAHNGVAHSRDWTAGWRMFVDTNANDQLDAGEEIIRQGGALAPPLTLFGSASFANTIGFDSSGRLTHAGGGSFVLCYGPVLVADGQARSRAVIVNVSGRVRIALDTDGDRVPELDSGPVPNCHNA
ncbi:MAG: GspH/FimT family protein [Sutterellaceae bacterium]|nr:GspH/FimT family protein [Burkholderiaceae bacterium]MDW8429723.1 GspH/FimT family protein [Sutterellaceae bacterium]